MDKASASSIEWVVSTIEDYALYEEILEITFHINLLAFGSIPYYKNIKFYHKFCVFFIPVDGSSKNTTGGLPSKAIATDNFLLLPPL